MRGWNHGKGDPVFSDKDAATRSAAPGGVTGDSVGSFQPDSFASHTHPIVAGRSDGHYDTWQNAGDKAGYAYGGDTGHPNTQPAGGQETRPANAYVLYAIYTGLRPV